MDDYCPAGAASAVLCPAGSYCPTPAVAPVACAIGDYCPSGVSSPILCPAGSYCPNPSVNISCPIGSWSNSSGLTMSAQCTQCAAGRYGDVPGQISLSAACHLCTAGSYCTGGASITVCTIGYYCPVGSTSASLALLVVTVLIRLPSLVALPADGAAVLALPLIRSALHALQAHTVISQGRIIPALVALPPAQQARMVVPLARQIPLLAVSLARKAIIAAVERISSLALLVVGATAMDCQ